VKYAFITRCREEFKLRLMCRVLQVSPSGYYAWRKRSPSLHALADEALMVPLWTSYAASDRTYGAPRVHRDLRDEGHGVGKKRVARLMREHGLVGRTRGRRRVETTESEHDQPIAPNLLGRQFDVKAVGGINRVWVSDITYVPTGQGWLFLAVVVDLGSRRVVGWAMRDTLHAELATSALQMALRARQPPAGLIHHSDRGIHYACREYRELLAAHGMRASMSRRGDCWDNAVAESFFSTLEWELIMRSSWPTRADARGAIFRFIESWYNRRRRHSTLGYVSPTAYEAQLKRAA
jgi:putative transposase